MATDNNFSVPTSAPFKPSTDIVSNSTVLNSPYRPYPSSQIDSGISPGSSPDTRSGGDDMGLNPDIWSDPSMWDKSMLINILLRFGLSQDRAEYEAQRIANNLVYTGNDVPIFSPDPNATPSENLANLTTWLFHAIGAYEINNSLGFDKSFNFANQLIRVFTALSNSGNSLIEDLSDGATLELAEKITDNLFSFINAQFSSALSYQSWYLQQEYNSPVNQISRLAQAGLSSAFVLGGGMSSGNASQPASMPQIQQPSPSNAGQAEVQAQANEQQFISSMIGNGISLASMGFGAFKTFVEATAIKRLTPLQMASAGTEILNNAASYERLLSENDQIKQSMQIQSQQLEIQKSQSALDSASNDVSTSKGALDTFFEQHRVAFQETAFSTTVKDKTGATVRKVYDNDGINYIMSHNGRDVEGNQVVEESYFNQALNGKYSAKGSMGVKGIASAESGFEVSAGLEHGNKDIESKSKTSEKGWSNSSNNSQSHSDGSENTNTWRVGNTEFHQEIHTRYLMPDEFKSEYKKFQDRYDNALSTYNSMSAKHKAMLMRMHHCQVQNFGRYSSLNVLDSVTGVLNKAFGSKKLQGD